MKALTFIGSLAVALLILPAAAEALQIVAPARGTTVQSGASVTVRVLTDPADQISDVAVAIGDQSVVATPTGVAGTFEGIVVVPRPLVGPDFIVAVGTSPTGQRRLHFV